MTSKKLSEMEGYAEFKAMLTANPRTQTTATTANVKGDRWALTKITDIHWNEWNIDGRKGHYPCLTNVEGKEISLKHIMRRGCGVNDGFGSTEDFLQDFFDKYPNGADIIIAEVKTTPSVYEGRSKEKYYTFTVSAIESAPTPSNNRRSNARRS